VSTKDVLRDNPMPPSLTGGQKTVFEAETGLEFEVTVIDGDVGFQVELGMEGTWSEVVSVVEIPSQGEVSREGVQLALDWLDVTLHPGYNVNEDLPDSDLPGHFVLELDRFLANVQLAASSALGCEPGDWVETDSGFYGYQKGLVGPGQARIWWDAPGRDDCHIRFPGQACQIAGKKRLVQLLRYSLAHGGKATRCDTVIDDYQHIVSPAQVQEALQGPDVVTHARKGLVQQGFEVGSPDLTGATTYLGSPTSRQRVRVYDKGLESGGEIDCIRWELESRKEAAETMAAALAYEDWGQVMASRLVGFVDFRAADSHSEVEERKRLPWFQQLVGLARKASAYLPKVPRTVEEVVDWVDRAIGPSLAVAMRFWKGDLAPLDGILRNGERRWKPRHKAMVASLGVA